MGTIKFTPRNETQVREWFAAHLTDYEYSIVDSKTEYPDYLLEDGAGVPVRTEVEHKSANFISHKHDPVGCDLILCWQHNAIIPVRVLELSTGRYYEPGEPPTETEVKYEYRTKLESIDRKQLSIALMELEDDVSEFIRLIAEDLAIISRYQKEMVQPRLRLLARTEVIVRELRNRGIDLDDMHPYDLLKLLT